MAYPLSMAIGLVVSLLLSKAVLNLVKDGGMSVINYRKEEIPVALGTAIIGCIIAVSVIFHLTNIALIEFKLLFIYAGVFIIGFLDDALHDKENKGFKGHFRAFLQGRITTGFLKALGIPLLLLFYFTWDNYFIIIDLVFVALTVNLFNFFDLRPGRCQKVFLLSNLILFIFLESIAPLNLSIIGVVLYTLILDLREHAMLGDSGANLLGVITGMLLLNLPIQAKVLTYSIILALTVIGERYSFTKIIERNNILRYLDKLGRI